MTMQCFNCGKPLDVATAYMVIPYVGERYGWYCNEDCYKEDEHAHRDMPVSEARNDVQLSGEPERTERKGTKGVCD